MTLLVCASGVGADALGHSYVIRSGWVRMVPYETSEPIAFSADQVDNDWQMSLANSNGGFLSVSWRPSDSVALGLYGAGGFTADLRSESGLNAQLDQLNQSPTIGAVDVQVLGVSVEFFPLNKDYWLQPFVALGVHGTGFDSVQVDNELRHWAVTTLGSDVAELEVDDVVGLQMGIGVDLYIWKHVGLAASIQWLDVGADTTLTLADGRQSSFEMQLDPWLFNVGLVVGF